MNVTSDDAGKSSGCLLFLILFVGLFVVVEKIEALRTWYYAQSQSEQMSFFFWCNVVFIVVSFLVGYYVYDRVKEKEERERERLKRKSDERRRKEQERERERREQRRRLQNEKEAMKKARSLVVRTKELQDEVIELESSFQGLLDQASASLAKAESEWEERVFGPFWNRIEETTLALARFSHNVDRLHAAGQEYKAVLGRLRSQGKKYVHHFRSRGYSFPGRVTIESPIPNPSAHVSKLRTLTRKGQKDFQFAVVGEQHLTRRVLVEGFSTVLTAIDTLGSDLQNSLSSLSDTVSAASANIVASVEASSAHVAGSVYVVGDAIRSEVEEVKDLFEEKWSDD